MVARTLVDADARGIASHGMVRLPIYVQRLRSGLVDATAEPRATTRGAVVHVDAANCVGALGARVGVQAATDLAARLGVGLALVNHSNHCGALGFHVRDAAQRGFLVLGASNAPATMAYHGGRTRAVGTNPFAIAAPRADGPPLVLDAATSTVARGKIIVAAAEGQSIPEGWAIDSDGNPTTDAERALEGAVLPFGGPKGSGIAMMIDLLCSAVGGADHGRHIGDMYEDWDRPQNVGHVFLAISPHDQDLYLERVTAFVADVATQPPAAGVEWVLLPGEVEDEAAIESTGLGILLASSTIASLAALAAQLDVDPALFRLDIRGGRRPVRPPERQHDHDLHRPSARRSSADSVRSAPGLANRRRVRFDGPGGWCSRHHRHATG